MRDWDVKKKIKFDLKALCFQYGTEIQGWLWFGGHLIGGQGDERNNGGEGIEPEQQLPGHGVFGDSPPQNRGGGRIEVALAMERAANGDRRGMEEAERGLPEKGCRNFSKTRNRGTMITALI